MEGKLLVGWLENLAQFLHRHLYALALLVLAAVGIILLADVRTHWLENLLAFNLLEKTGKSAGKMAATIAFAAISYYVLRELYVAAKRRKLVLPGLIDAGVKYLVTVLRLSHPFFGILVLATVLFHGYVLWMVWAAGNFNLAVNSGILAFVILAFAALTGLCIRLMPKMLKFRYLHRIAGILFIAAFWLHEMFE